MTNPFPLLIIMGTIVVLVAIQRALTKMDDVPVKLHEKAVPPPPPPPSKPRGIMLFPGLTVTGLDERGTDHLKGLISKGDSAALAAFLASHRPGILELDEYLEQVRAAFNDALSVSDVANKSSSKNIRNSLKIFKPLKPPANIHFELLSPSEYEECLTFNPKSKRLVTRDLMAQFGGQKFSTYFEYYCAHGKSVTMSVPPLDPDRPIMEALSDSGIADKGRHIPLETRLTVLKMNQLRQMNKDLNQTTKFTRKQDATKALAQIPGSAVLLSMSYVVDDLFVLNPIENETYDINREWNYISAYAKLLISRTNSNTAPLTS
ncbi:MAG: hypothetical protein KAU29_00945 [Gammaproteobacteria bacterium]|nr:hypothetical protein [Gammaproteobacteria bacterium]